MGEGGGEPKPCRPVGETAEGIAWDTIGAAAEADSAAMHTKVSGGGGTSQGSCGWNSQ